MFFLINPGKNLSIDKINQVGDNIYIEHVFCADNSYTEVEPCLDILCPDEGGGGVHVWYASYEGKPTDVRWQL